ncbi:hypothetical protein BGW39_011312 [Mortierella sp. 14UC]|nr:hypothetical protein BGW39_011312 [Mortierella sp. 14UC]
MIAEDKPTVMIIGAGLGGLLLGVLLHRAGISFYIYEKSTSINPIGSAIPIGGQILPLFAQLGLDKEFFAISKPMTELRVYNDRRELNYTLDFLELEQRTGYKDHMVARPALYDLLVRQIPPERLHLGKRLVTKLEANDGIIIRMSDGTTYKGDILVGADGAYSTVRHRLMDRLKNENRLCPGDREALPFRTVVLAGQTQTLDPEEFPQIKEALCDFSIVCDRRPCTISITTTPHNTITWMVVRHFTKSASKDAESQRLKNAENSGWGPFAIQSMCDETRGFSIPGGNRPMTLGDLMDRTPTELISRVLLEEKVFETWYNGRTVLLGDGAVCAMKDAVALANLIYTLPITPSSIPSSAKLITNIFEAYKAERYPASLEELQFSQALSRNGGDRSLSETMAWFVVRQIVPTRLWRQVFALNRRTHVRPLVAYLPIPVPLVLERTTTTESGRSARERKKAAAAAVVEPVLQNSFVKAREVYERRRLANMEP